MKEARAMNKNSVLTCYEAGYDRQYQIFEHAPELRRALPSVGWIAAAVRSCIETTLNRYWMANIHVPTVCLLAGDERVVNLAKSLEMLAFLPNKQTQIIEGARHELLNEFPEVANQVIRQIEDFLYS